MVLGNYHVQFEEILSNQMRYIFVEMEQLQKDYKKEMVKHIAEGSFIAQPLYCCI